MRKTNRVVLLSAIAGLSILCTACGGESGSAEESAVASDTAASTESPDASTGRGFGTGEADCSDFTEDLLKKWGLQKQLVLNLAMTSGRNLKTMRETTGTPAPEVFRTLAEAFDNLDVSGIEPMDMFDTPETIAEDLRKTGDLVEAALAAGGDTTDPAWTALHDFYDQKFFIRHNSSISYYLDEAGCV